MGQPEIVELSPSASLAHMDDMVDGWCAGMGLSLFPVAADKGRVEIDREMADLTAFPITFDERPHDGAQRDFAHRVIEP